MNCRHCATPLHERENMFVDLGFAPPSNAFVRQEDLEKTEPRLPLKAFVCYECLLVQADEVESRDMLFSNDYVYFSSYSSTWLAHAEQYVANVVGGLALDGNSLVVEIASNDGYLLQYMKRRGIPCVGIEPTASTSSVARGRGIESIEEFFGAAFAQRFVRTRRKASLIVANNVLAHVPDINDFVSGVRELLDACGTVTLEFPHLTQLVSQAQFDTIYHEHYSYLTLHAVKRILASQGLVVWRVQQLPTHGGSLRVWAQHTSNTRAVESSVEALLHSETTAGVHMPEYYRSLQPRAEQIMRDFVSFLLAAKSDGKRVMGYGAAAKGNTLLNFAGVDAHLLPCVVDASPHKQGRYLPGSRIPVVAPSAIALHRPDFIVVFPWNIKDEIVAQLADARSWGARFVTAVPNLTVS